MRLKVNGNERLVDASWQDETLLDVLREQFGLIGTRYSCGIGQCGACTVHVDGEPVNSCLLPVRLAEDKEILTIEGLQAADGSLHPLQNAWIEAAAPQCGFCQSGQIMRALSLLKNNSEPSASALDEAMNGNLCRCGSYPRIKQAIRSAAESMQGSPS